jgi:PilZ domain
MASKRELNTRVFRRTPTLIPVALLLRGQRRRNQNRAAVLQTSFLGMRVRTSVSLKRGQAVRVVRMTGPYAAVPARVVWVSALGSDKHRQVGLQFTDPMRARITPH